MKAGKSTIGFIMALMIGLVLLSACKDEGDAVSSVPTAENTATSEPSATPTDEPTETPEPTATDTQTPTATPTDTPEPTATSIPTRTPTATPTETPTATNTAVPTRAATAVSATSAPAATEPPATADSGGSSDFPLPLPVGVPASQWNGIPIMPQAIAGQEDEGGYIYTVGASVQTISSYYQSQMINLGWDLLATSVGANDAVILIFQNFSTGEVASVAILTVDANTRYVLLVKS
jgi:outer membrane biosynthesis protein TonB